MPVFVWSSRTIQTPLSKSPCRLIKPYFLLFITPTSCICEPPDLLAIDISLVPDQPVD